MRRLSTRWQIAIPNILIILLGMFALSIFLSNYISEVFLENLEEQLYADASLISESISSELFDVSGSLDQAAVHFAQILNGRVTFIAVDGVILGDSDFDHLEMDNHLYRMEIQEALQQNRGSSIRFSNTAGEDMLYVAVKVPDEIEGLGYVRLAKKLDQIYASRKVINQAIFTGALITMFFAAVLVLFIADRSTVSVRKLTEVVKKMAAGDMSARLFPSSYDEVGQLTIAFNHLSDQLQDKVEALSLEHQRLMSILKHMVDGVVITDSEGQVEMINPSACRLLSVTEEEALDKSLASVIRNYQIIELWQNCRDVRDEQFEVIETTINQASRFLQVFVSPLDSATSEGFLMILQDLTQIRRLETVRRDFISNISHELRTPIASLKLLVETLQDGAKDDPGAAERFLLLIQQQIDTMNQLVEELLELSRIESGKVPMRIQAVSVADLIAAPFSNLQPQADRAGIQLKKDIYIDLPLVMADAERVQRVVMNLMHNAIKFTEPGGEVRISAYQKNNQVVIAVSDTGVGIPEKAIPRLFERFFKADRARSGGGVGLGLSIARHIVQVHGGKIWVESLEGVGSTFYFTLPAVNPQSTSGDIILD